VGGDAKFKLITVNYIAICVSSTEPAYVYLSFALHAYACVIASHTPRICKMCAKSVSILSLETLRSLKALVHAHECSYSCIVNARMRRN